MTAPASSADRSLGDLLDDADLSTWSGTVSLPVNDWVRLGETDYEVMQQSGIGAWVAQWKVGRLTTHIGSSDVVRVDLGVSWAFAPVIPNGAPRVIYDSPLDGTDDVTLKIRYAPCEPAEMATAVATMGQVYGVIA